jgi:hypothetical protein
MTLSTPGTLGLAVADLDGDHRLDVVQSQGEVTSPDKVLLANTGVSADTRVPDVRVLHPADGSDAIVVARALDGKSPSMVHDWTRIELAITSPGTHAPITMEWRGEYLWAAELTGAVEGDTYQVCAVDAAGNQGCSDTVTFGASPDGGPGGDDTGGKDGCCSTSGSRGAGGSLLLALATLIAARRSRRARRGS